MLIFDIGASNGVFSKKYSNNSTVYAFEPNKTNLLKLIQNCKNIPNYNIIDKAVSDTEGVVQFYEANYTNASSILPFTDGVNKWKNADPKSKLATVNTYEVECIRLDTFIKQNNITKTIDFIKIDAQGHDLNVIKSLGEDIYNVREILAEVKVVEFELYKGEGTKKDMLDYMSSKDFSIYKTEPNTHHQEENIWFKNNKFNKFFYLK